MSRVSRSLSAEFRKIRSTKLWWILAIVLGAYSALMAGFFAFFFRALGEGSPGAPASPLPDDLVANSVYSVVTAIGYVVPLLLGALVATSELRHRTLALTFTLEPHRGTVLFAKIIVLITFGILLGAIGLAGSVGAGATVIATGGGDPLLGSSDTWGLFARVLAATSIWAVIGFGVGVLVRSQAFAIVLALVFTQFLEPILRSVALIWEWSAEAAKYFPGAATEAFVGASPNNAFLGAGGGAVDDNSLGIWAGLAVLGAYAVITVVAGWLLRWRRDVM